MASVDSTLAGKLDANRAGFALTDSVDTAQEGKYKTVADFVTAKINISLSCLYTSPSYRITSPLASNPKS